MEGWDGEDECMMKRVGCNLILVVYMTYILTVSEIAIRFTQNQTRAGKPTNYYIRISSLPDAKIINNITGNWIR